MIRFENVTKKFADGTIALENIDLVINEGEFVFIIGPSGAGKTTLLRLLTREILPSEGKIFVVDKEVNSLKNPEVRCLRRQVGAVYQDCKILADRTVWENVALVLEILAKKEKEIAEKTKTALTVVGLEGKEKLFPRQLAGGELQRVGLARALALEPKIIFADEPTGNLDPQTAWQIVDLLKEINEKGITLIIATHNFDIVDSLKKRVIRLEKGKIVSDEKKGKYKK